MFVNSRAASLALHHQPPLTLHRGTASRPILVSDIFHHFWPSASASTAIKYSGKAILSPHTTWKLHRELFWKALRSTRCDLHLFSGAITAEIRHNMMDSVLLNGRGLSMEITTDNSLHFNVISFLLITPRHGAQSVSTTWYRLQTSSKAEGCNLCLKPCSWGCFPNQLQSEWAANIFFQICPLAKHFFSPNPLASN